MSGKRYSVPNFDHPLCRDLLRHIRDEYRGNIDRFKCILIIGSSRIGKSYFMREHLVDPKYCITHSNELEFSITNWNELKCQSTHLAYTNTPLVDAEIADWCVEDFNKTFKTENKIDEFYIEEPKCVWTLKSD